MEISHFEPFIVRVLISFCVLFAVSWVNDDKKNECCQEYCYNLDHKRPQQAYFSSKTSYFIAKRSHTNEQFAVPNCNAEKIWLYVRHGARLPKAHKEMKRLRQLEGLRDEIIANYEQRNSKPAIGAMCASDLDLLKEWKWNHDINEEKDEFLTKQGWKEVKFVATRYQGLFPDIFEKSYNGTKFLFRHTDAQRTQASFRAFVDGIFGPNAHESIQIPPLDENIDLMKPYTKCEPHEDEITGNRSEYRKYLDSLVITNLVKDVSMRLGFKLPLKRSQIFDMYHMCLYDQSWNLSLTSAWCAIFTPSQFNDLEYPEDLRKFYESGYGLASNERLLCGLVNDMFNHLGNYEQPKAIVYFTHSSSLLLLLTTLKAFKDEDTLRADNYKMMFNRKWRLSEMTPFAANLAVVKYECPNDAKQEKIKFMLNEEPLLFEWCDNGVCDFSEFKARYNKFIEADCNGFFCSNSSNILKLSISPLLLAILAAFIIWLKCRD